MFINIINAQPGSLDPTFGSGGKVFTFIGSGGTAYAMALQNDGKIVTAGVAGNGSDGDFALTRYNTNGSPDFSFNGNAVVITSMGPNDDLIRALAIQADGRIVVAGYSNNGQFSDVALARYNSNGSLDATFDIDGKVITSFGEYAEAVSVVIQSDGKIVIAGRANNSVILARYNTNGSPDITFGTNGKTKNAVGLAAAALAIQSDGKFLVGGTGYDGSNVCFGLMRFNINGTLDISFNGTGITTTNFGASGANATAMNLLSDGKIVLAGFNYLGNNINEFAVAKYNADGSPDLSFDNDGRLTTQIASLNNVATSMDIQSDGKIVVGGYGSDDIRFDFVLARYNSNGSLDPAFGVNGKVLVSMAAFDDEIYTLKATSNRIYAAGSADISFVIAAFQKDPVPLPVTLLTFNTLFTGSTVKCSWQTAGEINTAHYVVQRSSNSIDFLSVGNVNANTGASTSRYSFDDNLPTALLRLPALYYRLKITDNDGRFTFSPVAKIEMEKQSEYSILPNPAHNYIKINGDNLKYAQVLNSAGQLVLSSTVNRLGGEISVAGLPKGAYTIKITDQNGNVHAKKLLIQ